MLLLAVVAGVTAFSPQRTPQRDKLFFGIVSDSPATVPNAVILPPANSQLGVNDTAAGNSDLNDFGSRGVPPAIAQARAKAAESAQSFSGDSSSSGGNSFLIHKEVYSGETESYNPVKRVSNILSVVWLVLFVIGIAIFLHNALQAGSRKVMLSPMAEKKARKAVENRRIDREAYVYVDGG